MAVPYSQTQYIGVNLQEIYTPVTPDNYGYVGSAGDAFPVGTIVDGTDATGKAGAKYMWVLAEEDLDQYDAVGISEAFVASQLTDTEAADGWKFGVAFVDIPDGSYGWVQVKGACTVFVVGSVAVDSALVSSSTAGALDDVTTAGTRIQGIVPTAANTLTTKAAVAAFMAVEPFAELPPLA